MLVVAMGLAALGWAQSEPEIGRVTRVQRKPNVRVFSLRESNAVRAVVYTVETPTRIYVAMDVGKKYIGTGYPKQVYQKGERVQVRVDQAKIEIAPIAGGTWERMEMESEEDK
jgi:hypothetical protein